MVAMATEDNTLVNSDVKILFWNSRSISNKSQELEHLLNDVDILVAVETWLKAGSIFKIPGFRIYREDRPSTGGGILFAVRSGINFRPIVIQEKVDDSVEVAAIKIFGYSNFINLFAVYRAPGVNRRNITLSQEQWDKVTGLTIGAEGISYLLGDFNSHNIQWNCRYDDVNGARFLDSLTGSNLLVLNFDTVTHLNASNNETSNIDLVIANAHDATFVNIEVYDELFDSDHFPIKIGISLSKYIFRRKSFKIRSKQTNWNVVDSVLEDRYAEFFDIVYVNSSAPQKYETFVAIVKDAIVKNTPKRREVSNKIHRNPVEWWDEDCARLKRLRRAAFKKWRWTKTLADRIQYKKSCAVFRRAIKNKKKACFIKFTESIDFNRNVSYVWDKMRIFRNKWQKVNHPSKEAQDMNFSTMANEVIDKITAAPSTEHQPPDTHDLTNSFFDKPFTFAELNLAIDSRNTSTGSGLDGIDYYTISRLPIKYKLILVDIYNEMLCTGEYPNDWKNAYIHLIKKPDSSGLRPITMTQCLCKIFEIIMKNRLQWWCEHNGIISSDQSGFRKGRSCVDNIFNLTLCVQDGFVSNRDTVAVFLDIKGAFDNVIPAILLQQLCDIGCSNLFIKFVSHLCLERYVTSAVNLEVPRKVTKGVPQGGVLSPLLFNIYVRNIADGIR